MLLSDHRNIRYVSVNLKVTASPAVRQASLCRCILHDVQWHKDSQSRRHKWYARAWRNLSSIGRQKDKRQV